MNHTSMCRILRHSDAAKRASGEYNTHYVCGGSGAIGHWIAVSLQDGSSDHQLYATKREAVRHQHHNEKNFAFVQIQPQSMPVCDAEVLLFAHRKMVESGVTLIDRDAPSGGREVIRRLAREDMRNQLRSIRNGGRTVPSNLTFPQE